MNPKQAPWQHQQYSHWGFVLIPSDYCFWYLRCCLPMHYHFGLNLVYLMIWSYSTVSPKWPFEDLCVKPGRALGWQKHAQTPHVMWPFLNITIKQLSTLDIWLKVVKFQTTITHRDRDALKVIFLYFWQVSPASNDKLSTLKLQAEASVTIQEIRNFVFQSLDN